MGNLGRMAQHLPKTVLITGTSSGFGKLLVPLLLEQGYHVGAALRGGEQRLRMVFPPDLLERFRGRIDALDLHLEKPETLRRAQDWVRDRCGGRLDILINNAGYGLFGALEDLTAEQLRHEMEVNFFGPMLLTKTLLPSLRAARGRVINLSSIAGRMAFPLYDAYCASKFALEGMVEAMWYELRPHGVQVALVEPGGFRTEFSVNSHKFAEKARAEDSIYRERTLGLERALREHTSRLGDPQRVARLVLRLCEKRKLRLRYPIGVDARLLMTNLWLFPQGWVRAVQYWVFRKLVFRD